MRNFARNHLEVFATRIAGLPDASQAPFLPVALCELYLKEMDKRRYDPFKTPIILPQWRRQWTLWRASRNWRS
jgi:phytoene synthase